VGRGGIPTEGDEQVSHRALGGRQVNLPVSVNDPKMPAWFQSAARRRYLRVKLADAHVWSLPGTIDKDAGHQNTRDGLTFRWMFV